MIRLVATVLLVLASAAPASAERLYSVWTLEPTTPIGHLTYDSEGPLLIQRLLPYRAVRLVEPAQIKRNRQIDEGVVLFEVYQADGQSAYCTLKDQSVGNAARSLFIPILDKRPCLVDEDGDGRFDKRFNVHDNYGSALTPSGNLSKAKNLRAPAAYEVVEPDEFPLFRGFSFNLQKANDPEERSLSIHYDNGSGYVLWENVSPSSTPENPTALNVRLSDIDITQSQGSLTVAVDASVYLIGTSDGQFAVSALPRFVQPEN